MKWAIFPAVWLNLTVQHNKRSATKRFESMEVQDEREEGVMWTALELNGGTLNTERRAGSIVLLYFVCLLLYFLLLPVGNDDKNCEKIHTLILDFLTLWKVLISLQVLFFCYLFYALSYFCLPFTHFPLHHKYLFFSAMLYNIHFFMLSLLMVAREYHGHGMLPITIPTCPHLSPLLS